MSEHDLIHALEGVTDDAERLAIAAGVIVRHAAAQGVLDVVITGGAAVAILTHEDFGTRDIDVITAFGDELGSALEHLGFVRFTPHQHLWTHAALGLVVQSPASVLPPHSATDEVSVGSGDVVRVWSVTDLVVDRVAQAAVHGAYERLAQALALHVAAGDRFEAARAQRRAAADGVGVELAAFLRLAEDIPDTAGMDDPLSALGRRFDELLRR